VLGSGIIVSQKIVIGHTLPIMKHSSKLASSFRIVGLAVALVSALPTFVAADDIISQIVARCPAQPRTYAQVTDYLRQLSGASSRVKLQVIGYSHRRRPLLLVTVTDPDSPAAQKMRLFIIARQHGNEPAGTTATLGLVEHFAHAPSALEQAVLKHLEIIAVPVANPDGAVAHQRRNAAGVDLNRDWQQASQPETQALQAAVYAYQPHAIMDLHELPAHSSRASYQQNFVETIGTNGQLPAPLSAYTGAISKNISLWMTRYSYGLNVFYDYPGDSLKLCHRYLGLYQGFPTFLCEVKPGAGRSLRYRAGFHILAAIVVANYLIHNPAAPRPAGPRVMQVAEAADKQTPVRQRLPQPVATGGPGQVQPITVALQTEPTTDSDGNQRMQIMTQVDGGSDFAFVTIAAGGVTRVLTNQRLYHYSLDLNMLPPGECPIVARAHDTSGRMVATQQLTLTVPTAGGTLGR